MSQEYWHSGILVWFSQRVFLVILKIIKHLARQFWQECKGANNAAGARRVWEGEGREFRPNPSIPV